MCVEPNETEKTLFHGAQWGRPAWGLKEKGVFCQEGKHPLLSNWSTVLTEIVVHNGVRHIGILFAKFSIRV